MAYLMLTLALATIGLAVAFLRHRYSYWEKRGVPHERPALLFGSLKGIGRTVHFRDVNRRIYHRFKSSTPIAGMYLFVSKALLVLDLELIKHVLIKDFSSFHDRGIFNNVRDDPLTGHLLTLEGEQWRSMRNKLTPVFTSGKMKFMFTTVVDVGKSLAEACGTMASVKENGEGILELKELSARYTTDVIGTCAFGIECNSLQDPNAEFRKKGRSIFEQPRHSQIVQSFMITNPGLARKLRMKLFPDEVSEFFLGAVRRTVDYRIKNDVKRNDFMDQLIELKAQDEEAAKRIGGIDLSQGLTLEQMAAQAFVFFLAGFDTSSTTMSFCLYELAVHQKVQDELRAEVMKVLQAHNGELTYESIQEMTFLDQVLAETLRKYPLLPHLVRKTTSDYRVPNTSHIIEKDTTILIPVDAIHHDENLYPQPEKFDPSRFAPEAVKERHPSAYLPFGDGPRNCIGMRFGKMQAKVGLISLLKKYKFLTCDLTDVPPKFSKKNFLLATEKGIYLRVESI